MASAAAVVRQSSYLRHRREFRIRIHLALLLTVLLRLTPSPERYNLQPSGGHLAADASTPVRSQRAQTMGGGSGVGGFEEDTLSPHPLQQTEEGVPRGRPSAAAGAAAAPTRRRAPGARPSSCARGAPRAESSRRRAPRPVRRGVYAGDGERRGAQSCFEGRRRGRRARRRSRAAAGR